MTSTRRWHWPNVPASRPAPCPSAWWATGPRSSPSCVRRDVAVDIATDQTPAHDPLSYVPAGMSLADSERAAGGRPEEYVKQARASMASTPAMVELLDEGTRCSTTATACGPRPVSAASAGL